MTSEACTYGIDSSYVLLDLIGRPHIVSLIDDILTKTYIKYFGERGHTFIKQYISILYTLNEQDNSISIKTKLSALRCKFNSLGLNDYYTGVFRKSNLMNSLSMIDSDYLAGRIIDIGADDNSLAQILISKYSKVSYVLGTDISDKNKYSYTNSIDYAVQENAYTLPVPNDFFNVAICRYSLHHMGEKEQLSILSEISRVLTDTGVLIVYENSFSFKQAPLVDDGLPFHNKICTLNENDIKTLMSVLDVFSLGIKEKNQHFPFTFRTVEEWTNIFSDRFIVENARYYGVPDIDLHQQPLAIFILNNCKSIKS